MPKVNIKDLLQEELTEFLLNLGDSKYRAQQIWDWLYRKQAVSYSEMTNLPRAFREKLAQSSYISWPELRQRQESGAAVKYLFGLVDGQTVETVLMRYRSWNSLCLSTQVGCSMGCKFCASTLSGKTRDLTVAEMLDQVLFVQKELNIKGELPISRVVLMGTGEPLDNFTNVVRFLHILHDPKGLNIGYRRVTISTCGLVPGIKALARENIPVTLSVSLHAPSDRLRNKLLPINKKYPLDILLSACHEYIEITGRRITFEYTLIKGVNDSIEQAKVLADIIQGMLCHINVIPLNPVAECGLSPSSPAQVEAFISYLKRRGIPVTERRELGQDIDAACGQLRRRLK
ncbi:MAG: 23S rRNA (adenine(2503)-C(2))-methyltransferase RlmN [bacterium]